LVKHKTAVIEAGVMHQHAAPAGGALRPAGATAALIVGQLVGDRMIGLDCAGEACMTQAGKASGEG
jgi:hypothetical protein